MAYIVLKEKANILYEDLQHRGLRLFYKTKPHFPLMFLTLICITDVKYYFSVASNGNATLFVWVQMIMAMFGATFGVQQLLLPTSIKQLIRKEICRQIYGETINEEPKEQYEEAIENYLHLLYNDIEPAETMDDFPERTMSREEFLNQFKHFKLQIGDRKSKFTATKTELQHRSSIFQKILKDDTPYKVNNQGCIFIMQNPKYFPYILKYLQTGKTEFSEQNFMDLSKCQNAHGVLMDAQFYELPELVIICQTFLQNYSNYQGYQRMCYTKVEKNLVITNQEIAAFFVLGQATKSNGEDAYYKALVYAVDKLYSFGGEQPNVNFVLDLSEKTAKSYIEIYFKGKCEHTIVLYDGNGKIAINPEADISSAIAYIWEYKLHTEGNLSNAPRGLAKQKMRPSGNTNNLQNVLSITQ